MNSMTETQIADEMFGMGYTYPEVERYLSQRAAARDEAKAMADDTSCCLEADDED